MRQQVIRMGAFLEEAIRQPPGLSLNIERMNQTIKDATAKRFHYSTHDELRAHLDNFVSAYNFGRRLKTLTGC